MKCVVPFRHVDIELAIIKEKELITKKSLLVDSEIPKHTQYIQQILGTNYVVRSRENNVIHWNEGPGTNRCY